MLLEVLPAHEELLAVIALEVLLPGVDDHVRLQVCLLCEGFVTEGAAVILLTYECTGTPTDWHSVSQEMQEANKPDHC